MDHTCIRRYGTVWAPDRLNLLGQSSAMFGHALRHRRGMAAGRSKMAGAGRKITSVVRSGRYLF
jgi:hypothetical protein